MPDFGANCCTRFRYRYSQCRRCADACPHEAIALTDEGAKLDSTRCKHCMLCVSACHVGAWRSADFKPIDILRQAIKKTEWHFACAPSGCSGDTVIPCLGAVDATWLAYMAKRRIPVSLHGSGHCATCVHGKTGAAQLQLNLEAVEQLMLSTAQAEGVEAAQLNWVSPTLPEDGREFSEQLQSVASQANAASRQSLFRRIFRRDRQRPDAVDAQSVPRKVEDKAIRAGSYSVSERRELLQIVCRPKTTQPFIAHWHEALPLMQLSLQSGCTLCEACFRVCPTAAIQIVENPGDWALTFQTDRCVACEVCLEVCQPRVLDAAASFDARPEQATITLISRVKQRCTRCDRHFVSPTPQKTCAVCSDDEDAFEAIFG